MTAQEKIDKRLAPGNIVYQVTTDAFYPSVWKDDKVLGELLPREEWDSIPAGKYALLEVLDNLYFGKVMANSLGNEDGEITLFRGERNLTLPTSYLTKVWAVNEVVCRWLI